MTRLFPDEKRLYSPFLGGGAVELRWSAFTGGSVVGADIDRPLMNYWHWIIEDAPAIAQACLEQMPLTKEFWSRYYPQQHKDFYPATFENAVRYILLRRIKVPQAWGLSFVIMDEFNRPSKHRATFAKLRQFKAPRFQVYPADFQQVFKGARPDDLFYCDPPFVSFESVYDWKGKENPPFDHEGLADCLSRKNQWVLSYGDHEWVRDRYADYPMLELPVKYENRRIAGRDVKSKELLILSR